MATEHSVDERLPAAVMALPQQPFVLDPPVRSENDAQSVKTLYPVIIQEKKTTTTVAVSQQFNNNSSNADVVQFGGTGFSFTPLLGSSHPLNDIASSTWDDDVFLSHEDMEMFFGTDELDVPLPASPTVELKHASPASEILPPVLIQPTTDLAAASSSHTSQLVSSSSDSSAGGSSVNIDAVPTMKVQITKNLPSVGGVSVVTRRKRLKRQDEVALLREEAPKLQAQLDMLREYWRQEAVRIVQRSSRNIRDHRDTINSAEPKWKTLEAQSRDELAASEKQNERLKAQLQRQRKALQHIRKLVRKRVISAQNLEQQLDRFFQFDPQQIRIGITSAFQFLLDDSNAMFQSFEKVQMAASLRKSGDDELRYWEMRQSPENKGTFVEMIERYVVPFDRSIVVKALQKIYGKPKEGEHVYEFLSSSKDMIMIQFIAGFANSNGSGRVRRRYAARISEHETTESTRFLVTGLIDRLTETGESRNLVQLREQTWTLVRNCESSTPQHPLTVLQKYYTMAPEVSGDDFDFRLDNLWDTKIIQKVLIPTLDLSMDKLRCTLESEMVNLGSNFTSFRRSNATRIESEW